MRLGLMLGYWSPDGPGGQLELAIEADRLGYDSCWVSEAYGSDAVSVLGFLAARTRTIGLGAAVLQIPARTPAMTAMTAATLDQLSEGRFRLGLGVSGPQVSEGWYGVRFGRPLARTREYVDVVRAVLRRERLEYAGDHVKLPLPDGPGKALRLAMRPRRPDLPIYLAAVGPRNLELAGEIADGWLGVFVSPEYAGENLAHIRTGRERAGRSDGAFDTMAAVPVVIGDDVPACAEPVRAYTALYLGGMGSRKQNFYNALAVRMGYAKAAARVQDLYLAGKYREAAAAVPLEFVDKTALLGPRERITERLHAYAEAGITTLSVLPFGPPAAGIPGVAESVPAGIPGVAESVLLDPLRTVRTMAEIVEGANLKG